MAADKFVAPGRATPDDDVVPYRDERLDATATPESDAEAEERGPDENWVFWKDQINGALRHEKRFRNEGAKAEDLYFGDEKESATGGPDRDTFNISDDVALIHATIDVLKPLVYSDMPQPVVRRRFVGDGQNDETALMAAEAAQRLAEYGIETSGLHEALEAARDDWLIPGRGAMRWLYRARVEGERKVGEEVLARHVEWRRLLIAPGHTWITAPWIGFETQLTRTEIERRFDPLTEEGATPISQQIKYDRPGMATRGKSIGDDTVSSVGGMEETETEERRDGPFDTCTVWELWDRSQRQVLWWSPDWQDGLLDKENDPLELECFWPCAKPLLATTKGRTMTPRSDIAFYERRAREASEAADKLTDILRTVSLSGVFPGTFNEEIKKLLDGRSKMIAISDWIALMDKGGANNIIQWLPLGEVVTLMQALLALRQQAKDAMFEASGVSDIMRAQGDPNETATAQQIKGRYAGLRLSDRQSRMARFARDNLAIMLEIMLEHFDTQTLAEICQIDLPLTEMQRQQMMMEAEQTRQRYAQVMQLYQMAAQDPAMMQMLQAQGMPPEPPPPPFIPRIPETSWELIHARLREDYPRKITISIETQSTVLADEQADKEARIEFITAFSGFVERLAPLAMQGQFDFKVVKELLLFGVRGFPKSRTLEGLISSLPDQIETQQPEAVQVQVAKIRGEIDTQIKQMDLQDKEAERQHETKLKGLDLYGKSAELEHDAAMKDAPAPQQPQRG